jgi:fructose-bisphosphate aldolase class II
VRQRYSSAVNTAFLKSVAQSGLFRGCTESQAPFIIQISKGARSYADKRMLEAMIRTAEQIHPEAVFAVHLDHGDEATCYECIDSGFYSSVMIDASHEPLSNRSRSE